MQRKAFLATAAVFTLALAGCLGERNPPLPGPTLRLSQPGGDPARGVFEVLHPGKAPFAKLARVHWKPEQWQALLAVYVQGGRSKPVAFLGSYEVEGRILRFRPRFPLVRGVRYRVVFNPSRVPGQEDSGGKPLVAEFQIPRAAAAPTVVSRVYPTSNRLPENLLKFYIHFSAPMSRGDVYRHIRLLNASGKPVERPFLELPQELWDARGERFTLFIDPGRIKKGLKPREELGPVLEKGKTYTLVIDRQWPDADGNPLKETFRKTFQAAAAEEQAPGPQTWKVQPPPAGTAKLLTVTFPRPMDHALLNRVIAVLDAEGRNVPGTVSVTDGETRWHFTPRRPWRAGAFALVAGTSLEDLAGNNLERPFEVDVFRPIPRRVKAKTVRLPFRVKSEEGARQE